MAPLRQLAAQSLEFGNGLEDTLCNCIVSGINNEEAEQSKEEQKQGLSAEKLMRKASKDVCRLREQSQKVPVEVQSFREKIAYFTRAKINIPSLPGDDI
ncbi:unnamed protein product [Lepidochelys olivacea]